jgi:hypothetical protein
MNKGFFPAFALNHVKSNRKKEKKAILDEFINTTGYNRKYAVTVLNKAAYVHTYTFNNCRKKAVHIMKKKTAKRVYKKQYDEQVLNSLIKIWKFFDFQCGIRCETQESIERYGGQAA